MKPKRCRYLGLRCGAMILLGVVWVAMGAGVETGAMIGFVFFVAHIPPGILRDFPSPDRGRRPNAPKE